MQTTQFPTQRMVLMELQAINPLIRFADVLRFEHPRSPSKTCDCRLFYVLDGAASILIDRQLCSVRSGSLILFQPDIEYAILPSGSVTLIVLDFDYTQRYAADTGYLGPFPAGEFDASGAHERLLFSDAELLNAPLHLGGVSSLEPGLRAIVAEFHQRRVFYREMASALLRKLLIELIRGAQGDADGETVVAQVVTYISEHMDQHLSNAELGAALSYSPNYLSRLMLQQTGMSLHRYIMKHRLMYAANLLLSTQRPIGEIALSLGFNSASHFSNYFKKEYGFPPQQYRNGSI